MLTVFEEDEDEPFHTGLYWADGSPIVAVPEARKLGYIGFIPPDYYEVVKYEQMKKRRKRRARSRKSEA